MDRAADTTSRNLLLRHCWETLMHGVLLRRQPQPIMALVYRGIDLEAFSGFTGQRLVINHTCVYPCKIPLTC